MFTVYKLILNQKFYIGYTSRTILQRIHAHWYEANNWQKHNKTNTKWQRALLKYGKEAVTWEVLGEYATKEEACSAERFFIKEYNTIKDGYNTAEGGKGGKTKSPEQLEALRQRFIENNPSRDPEIVKKQQQSKKKYYKSEQYRQWSEENKERKSKLISGVNNPNYGGLTPAHKQKLKETLRIKHSKLTYDDRKTSYYKLTSPQGKEYIIHGKQTLISFLKGYNMNIWVWDRYILKGKQPKSGSSVGWTGNKL